MAETENLIESDASVIRSNIEETRASLSSKIDALEHEVKETAGDARASVEKQVDEVRKAFDLKYQISRNPWPFLAGAAVLGFLSGGALSKRRPVSAALTPGWLPEKSRRNGEPAFQGAVHSEGRLNGNAQRPQLEQAMQLVKATALGVVLSALREVTTDALPRSLAPHISELIDGVTQSLGGKPIRSTPAREAELH